MSKWTPGATLLSCVLLSSGAALAQTTEEFARGQTTVVVGANTITADNNVKFVNYIADETIPVTLSYSATCNIVFGGLTLRLPQPFTPPNVSGTISGVSGTPLGTVGTSGSVTFDIVFTSLKTAGKKDFGVAHLNLVLGVDSDCVPATGDAAGIDESVTIGVQISASTASHT